MREGNKGLKTEAVSTGLSSTVVRCLSMARISPSTQRQLNTIHHCSPWVFLVSRKQVLYVLNRRPRPVLIISAAEVSPVAEDNGREKASEARSFYFKV